MAVINSNERFTKLQEIFIAIKNIDNVVSSKKGNELDDIVNLIRNVNKKEFPEDIYNNIIRGYRDGLVSMYNKISDEISDEITNVNLFGNNSESEIEDNDSEYTLDECDKIDTSCVTYKPETSKIVEGTL